MSYSSSKEKSEVIMFIPTVGLLLVGLTGPSVFSLTPQDFCFLGVLAILTIVGSFSIIAASRRSEASLIAPLQYSQIIPAAFLGYLIWHTLPTSDLLIGGLMIIASGIILMRKAPQAKVEPPKT